METKSCLNCANKDRCLARSTTIFLLYIQPGRHEEVKNAQENMDISANCNNWEEKRNEA